LGQGYVRDDTANDIADAGVINAEDLDGEFDALLAAFVAATGHTHDGTPAEGGAITVVGPVQDFVGGAADFSPKTDSTYGLGKTATRWATGYIDDLNVTTNIVVGGTVDGRDVAADGTKLDGVEALADVTDATNVTAAGALMDSELTAIASVKALDQGVATTNTPTFAGVVTGGNVDGRDVSVDGTKLDTIEASADVTDTANVTTAGALMDSEVSANLKTLVLPATTTISTFGASLVDDANAVAGLVTLGLSATAAELNALDGISATVTELNYTDGVTSPIQTQLNSKYTAATQTEATWEAGTSTTDSLVSPAKVAAAIEALAAGGLGSGQTWQDVTASRASNTSYQNTTDKPIMVSIFTFNTAEKRIYVSSDNVTFLAVGGIRNSGSNDYGQATLVVPPDHYYKWDGFVGSNNWSELR
jgi:hypothetical protein